MYCCKSATISLHATELREKAKLQKYADAYKNKHNIHFIPVVLESGGAFGEKAWKVFNKICNFITQTSEHTKQNCHSTLLEIETT